MKNKETENDKPTPQGQITARQHFVPQFYLKKFVNSSGLIDVLDVSKKDNIGTPIAKGGLLRKILLWRQDG